MSSSMKILSYSSTVVNQWQQTTHQRRYPLRHRQGLIYARQINSFSNHTHYNDHGLMNPTNDVKKIPVSIWTPRDDIIINNNNDVVLCTSSMSCSSSSRHHQGCSSSQYLGNVETEAFNFIVMNLRIGLSEFLYMKRAVPFLIITS